MRHKTSFWRGPIGSTISLLGLLTRFGLKSSMHGDSINIHSIELFTHRARKFELG